jgi:hypothetical protein
MIGGDSISGVAIADVNNAMDALPHSGQAAILIQLPGPVLEKPEVVAYDE